MSTVKTLLIVSAGATIALSSNFRDAIAQEAPTPMDVNVVNAVSANILNTPSVTVTNQPTVDAIPTADSAPVVFTIADVPLSNNLTTDINFGKLEASPGERIIIDYVSVDSATAPYQRGWASLLPCTENGNQGRAAVPLEFGGPVYNGATRVNDAFLGTVAMHAPIEYGCTTVLRYFRSPATGLGHAHVTLQGHRVKKTLLPPIIIGQ